MDPLEKRSLSEQDICREFITPAIRAAGWNQPYHIREQLSLTRGRIIVRGQRRSSFDLEARKRSDYILFYKRNLPLAVVEAKDNTHGVADGMQQALGYADDLDIPFVFSSNGDAFQFHDRTGMSDPMEREISLAEFPSPEELWERYSAWKELNTQQQAVVTQDYYTDGRKEPRYYQRIAINRTIEAIAKGQQRLLLVMATGTGKTQTAFQIIWRLWKAGVKKRILFLADRNILIDQTRVNDFKPFGGAMTKIVNRQVDKSYEIYLCLYQAVTGTEVEQNIYQQFSPDFFDLVVIDECHRGSASEDSAWHEILQYFSSATHIGLTATPKETDEVSNTDYFGEPVYTYTLRQGIEDGFLAPYKVVRINIDKDLLGWRPGEGQRDEGGEVIQDRVYTQEDFDRKIVLEGRTELVAQKVTEFLHKTDRMAKTIVFCQDTDHAERMRQELVKLNADEMAKNSRYVMRITGDDAAGKAQLDSFIDPESDYPVVVTTSRLLSTGVDAQTCQVIVLDRTIKSMTEFKQIIGRGTRVNEEHFKFYFTIIDFRRATELFADPTFDGKPVIAYEPKAGESPVPPDEPELAGSTSGAVLSGERPAPGHGLDESVPFATKGKSKSVVGGQVFAVASEEEIYLDASGKPLPEPRQYARNQIHAAFATREAFVEAWNRAERKSDVLTGIMGASSPFERLTRDFGQDYDAFDLVLHLGYDESLQPRRDRATRARASLDLGKYPENARHVLQVLLDKYSDEGIEELEGYGVLKVTPLDLFATPVEILRMFKGKSGYDAAIAELKAAIYATSPL